jgi:hypothetical protein
MANICVYILSVEEFPGRIKIGRTRDFKKRLYRLNGSPGLTHHKLRQYFVDSWREAGNLESRLHSLHEAQRVPHNSSKEYYDVGGDEISLIRSRGRHMLDKLLEAEENAPASLVDCVKQGLVVLKATVYQKYCQRNGKRGHGGDVFNADMKRLKCSVPDSAVTPNHSRGQAAWSGYVKILPGASGFVSKAVVSELRAINRQKPRGKKSKIKPPKRDGSILTISCEAFRHLAPLVWPSRSGSDRRH